MKGNVIGFDADTNTGAISGHDGHRYEFVTADWHSHQHQPQHGDLVDFAPEGQRAMQVYLLEPEYVSPSFGQFYFSARGRISRSQFWLRWFLPLIIVGLVVGMLVGAVRAAGQPETAAVIYALFVLITLWPGIAVLVKRIHDRGKSGWLVLAPYIPLILIVIAGIAGAASGSPTSAGAVVVVLWVIYIGIGIWFFIEFGCMRGTVGANRFGPDPVRQR